MNSYERYVAMVTGERADVVPRIPILMQYAAEHVGKNYAQFASDYRVLVDANHRCAIDFDFDQLSAISDNYRETSAFGGEIEYLENAGPRCTAPLSDTKDLGLLQTPDPHSSARLADRVSAIGEYKKRFGRKYSIMGWIEGPAAEAGDVRGIGNFLVDVLDDEPFICDLMDICMDAGIRFARAQVDAGADTIGMGDAIASQVSPDMYERLIQPREKVMVQAIREMGALVKLHICGDITHLLPGIADLPISIIDVDHMVDLTKVRTTLPDNVAIAGNIDPVGGVLQGSPTTIREKVQQDYESVGNPYMVNAGCEIPPGTPAENLAALCSPLPYQE